MHNSCDTHVRNADCKSTLLAFATTTTTTTTTTRQDIVNCISFGLQFLKRETEKSLKWKKFRHSKPKELFNNKLCIWVSWSCQSSMDDTIQYLTKYHKLLRKYVMEFTIPTLSTPRNCISIDSNDKSSSANSNSRTRRSSRSSRRSQFDNGNVNNFIDAEQRLLLLLRS